MKKLQFKEQMFKIMAQTDLTRIRETAGKIRAKIGTLKLYGRLTEHEAESILKDTEIIMKEAV